MRLVVTARETVLLFPKGRVHWPHGGEPAFVFVDPGPDVTDYAVDGILAIGADGVDHGPDLRRRGALDAVATETFLAALLPRPGGSAADLHVGRAPLRVARVIPLDVAAPVPRWAYYARGPRRLPEHERGVPLALPARLSATPDAIALAVAETGTCMLVRKGDARPRLALRVPIDPEDCIVASPTPYGLLVTHLMHGRDGFVFHVDERGQEIGSSGGYMCPPAVWLGDRVLVYDNEEEDEERAGSVLDWKLDTIGTFPLFFCPTVSAASSDGRRFAFADGTMLARGTREAPAEMEIVDYAELLPAARGTQDAEAARRSYWPRRAHGAPALGFPARPVEAPPWRASRGAFELVLAVRSAGGAGRGIRVELAGPALAHVDFAEVEHGQARARFVRQGERARATLADVPLPPGVLLPLEPEPKGATQARIAEEALAPTHIFLRLRGEAREASSAMLEVSLHVPGSTSSPLRWTRPFVVA